MTEQREEIKLSPAALWVLSDSQISFLLKHPQLIDEVEQDIAISTSETPTLETLWSLLARPAGVRSEVVRFEGEDEPSINPYEIARLHKTLLIIEKIVLKALQEVHF